jgi:hypothetical protein
LQHFVHAAMSVDRRDVRVFDQRIKIAHANDGG